MCNHKNAKLIIFLVCVVNQFQLNQAMMPALIRKLNLSHSSKRKLNPYFSSSQTQRNIWIFSQNKINKEIDAMVEGIIQTGHKHMALSRNDVADVYEKHIRQLEKELDYLSKENELLKQKLSRSIHKYV